MIQGYTGWATGVNRIILDSSSITLGENALKTDELENGLKRSIKRGAFCPDKFSIKMSFDWVNDVYINGVNTHKTEYQLFTEWYKYTHKYGSVPFEFPEILYSQDTGIMILDTVETGPVNVEYYKITSSVPGNKSGEHIEVNMSWETVYGGTVEIVATTPHIATCEAHREHIDIYFDTLGSIAPTSQMFTLWHGNNLDILLNQTGFYYDNANTVRIQFLPGGVPLNVGDQVTFSMDYPNYVVEKGTYVAQVLQGL